MVLLDIASGGAHGLAVAIERQHRAVAQFGGGDGQDAEPVPMSKNDCLAPARRHRAICCRQNSVVG